MKDGVLAIGTGLVRLATATEMVDAGLNVTLFDQENEVSIDGRAFWPFGGLFLAGTPKQRWLGVSDPYELAEQ